MDASVVPPAGSTTLYRAAPDLRSASACRYSARARTGVRGFTTDQRIRPSCRSETPRTSAVLPSNTPCCSSSPCGRNQSTGETDAAALGTLCLARGSAEMPYSWTPSASNSSGCPQFTARRAAAGERVRVNTSSTGVPRSSLSVTVCPAVPGSVKSGANRPQEPCCYHSSLTPVTGPIVPAERVILSSVGSILIVGAGLANIAALLVAPATA